MLSKNNQNPALSEIAVSAALKGRKNAESLEEDLSRAVVTVGDMEEIKRKLAKLAMKTDKKRSIWAVLVLLFMGSLRGSELLSYNKLKFDPVKTLLGGDISLIKAIGPNGREVEIRLKQPKTGRSNPHQVVEMAETGGLLCSIKAWNSWRKDRKTPLLGGRPALTWSDGNLITMQEINLLLAALLPKAPTKIKTRAFVLLSQPC